MISCKIHIYINSSKKINNGISSQNLKVIVNGSKVEFDVQPFIADFKDGIGRDLL